MSNKHTAGLGVCDVLTIVFVVLKLLGVIKWSWLWVLSPTWICVLIMFVCHGIIAIADGMMGKKP